MMFVYIGACRYMARTRVRNRVGGFISVWLKMNVCCVYIRCFSPKTSSVDRRLLRSSPRELTPLVSHNSRSSLALNLSITLAYVWNAASFGRNALKHLLTSEGGGKALWCPLNEWRMNEKGMTVEVQQLSFYFYAFLCHQC